MKKDRKKIALILEEIAKENNYKFKSFSDDWIFILTDQNGVDCYIFGYKFPNNSSSTCRICDDKSALSAVLTEKGIPNIQHIYIENPKYGAVTQQENWDKIIEMKNTFGKLVLKANSGSCGIGVFKCSTLQDLENAYDEILKRKRALALCPYVEIEHEYRLICLNGSVKVVYDKQRPNVIGDGVHDIAWLTEEKYGGEKIKIDKEINLQFVPKIGEKIIIQWKHNLVKGSLPIVVDDQKITKKLKEIATNVSKALHLNFASIDIVETHDGMLKILEVNSGVMLEKFSSFSQENYRIAKDIYASALKSYFSQMSNVENA